MITGEQIRNIVEQSIAGTENFIVEVSVKGGNRILVEMDSPSGIKISECAVVHRNIESQLDRSKEDFELTVSSPGLGEPFKIQKQFQKNLGRQVKVVHKTGIVTTGELSMADENGIELTKTEKVKINGKKQIHISKISITTEQIKSTCLI